jgi:hypothetical protein
MLADSVEASTRALSELSPQSLEVAIENMIKQRFVEGQLDYCALTLRDLTRIKEAFLKILLGIHHQRIQYPDQERAEKLRAEQEQPGQDRPGQDLPQQDRPGQDRPRQSRPRQETKEPATAGHAPAPDAPASPAGSAVSAGSASSERAHPAPDPGELNGKNGDVPLRGTAPDAQAPDLSDSGDPAA